MDIFDARKYEHIPILGALLLALTNQSVLYLVAGAVLADYVSEGEYRELLTGFVVLAFSLMIGTRQLADMAVYVAKHREAVKRGLLGLLGKKYTINFRGKPIVIDVPDSLEPELAEQLVVAMEKLLSKWPAPTLDPKVSQLWVDELDTDPAG